ncbi:MAG: CPBP family intramembrane glutamic endopeptidase [Anaerolineae bacterium]
MNHSTPPRRHFWNDPVLLGGLALAYALFAFTFRGPRPRFWSRMTGLGLTLGSLALVAEPRLRRPRFGWSDLWLGLGSAGVLYVIFQIGDRLARWLLPQGASQIDSIYQLRRLRSKPELAARLMLVIGPAEELFWHGFVEKRLIQRYGMIPGAALGTLFYGSVHLASGNLTLIGAASVAGAFWGALAALGVPLTALIVSHIAWDIIIFLVAPTQKMES